MSVPWQIANPEYMRDTSADKVIPYYSFNIRNGPEYGEKHITTAADIKDSLLSVITPATLSNYLLGLYSAFLNIHGKRFAKPYTPTQLIKITSHVTAIAGGEDDEEYEWTLMPQHLNVKNGVFQLHWRAVGQAIKIELNEGEEEAVAQPQQKSPAQSVKTDDPALRGGEHVRDNIVATNDEVHFSTNAIQEVEIAGVAEDTTNSFLRLTSNSQLRDKRLLEEARIRAKWAQYKAERAIAKYVERYGELDEELLSDDDESGSGSDSE